MQLVNVRVTKYEFIWNAQLARKLEAIINNTKNNVTAGFVITVEKDFLNISNKFIKITPSDLQFKIYKLLLIYYTRYKKNKVRNVKIFKKT